MDTMEYATFRYDTIRLKWKTGFTMNSQYSRSLVGDDYSENSMQSHADNSIAIQERDECSSSEDEQSSITSENSAMEEIHSWTTLINDAASKVLAQYEGILQALLMQDHDESEAEQEAFEKILSVFQKEFGDVYKPDMDESVEKRSIRKKIMAT